MTQPRVEADLNDRLAIVTGGADGIGRALALKLTGIGCHVAIADINEAGLAGTTELCAAQRSGQISTHVVDVTDERALERFRDEALAHHDSNTAQLVFLNAGIAGGGSMFSDSREAWERTFDICWRASTWALGCCFQSWQRRTSGGSSARAVSTVSGHRSGLGFHTRVQRREVRGEGIHRSPDGRPRGQRSTR